MSKVTRILAENNSKEWWSIIGSVIKDFWQADKRNLKIVIYEAVNKRSTAQNALLWLWHREFVMHRKEHFSEVFTAEQWHEVWKQAYLGSGEPVKIKDKWVIPVRSTTSLSTKEMAAKLNQYQAEAAQEGCQFTQPPDLYFLALCKGER